MDTLDFHIDSGQRKDFTEKYGLFSFLLDGH